MHLFSSDPAQRSNTGASHESWADGDEDPSGYIVDDEGLVAAINTSLILQQPLLLTGDPGTGKTRLADRIAWHFGLPRPLRFQTKSTSESTDLFYTFDAIGRFNAAHSGDENAGDPRKFIHYRALGQAILETLEPEVRKDAGAAVGMGETRRNVVLIDEVDKAPRDFPNDLLGELSGRLKFTVPELQSKTFVADQQLSPIVIITSNSEKNLPDPFLRRCAYYHIEFPSDETLRRIVGARVEHPNLAETRLVTSAISAFQILRKRFSRKMSTAELIDWVRVLVAFDANPNQTVQQQSSLCGQTISSLAKTQIERKRA
ncbi:MAG: MoxR family ATPase, partial [Planctomycetota bacterium]